MVKPAAIMRIPHFVNVVVVFKFFVPTGMRLGIAQQNVPYVSGSPVVLQMRG